MQRSKTDETNTGTFAGGHQLAYLRDSGRVVLQRINTSYIKVTDSAWLSWDRFRVWQTVTGAPGRHGSVGPTSPSQRLGDSLRPRIKTCSYRREIGKPSPGCASCNVGRGMGRVSCQGADSRPDEDTLRRNGQCVPQGPAQCQPANT